MRRRTFCEHGPVIVDVAQPTLHMVRHDEPVTLVAVAGAVGEYEVLDGVVWPSRPGKDMVDLCRPGPERGGAVEAAALLQLSKEGAKPCWKRRSICAEQVMAQVRLFERQLRPFRHFSNPVDLHKWSNKRGKPQEFIRRAGDESKDARLTSEVRSRDSLGPVDGVEERNRFITEHLQQSKRIPSEIRLYFAHTFSVGICALALCGCERTVVRSHSKLKDRSY
jgi:hypothetical protein